jgi:hypothetical protein
MSVWQYHVQPLSVKGWLAFLADFANGGFYSRNYTFVIREQLGRSRSSCGVTEPAVHSVEHHVGNWAVFRQSAFDVKNGKSSTYRHAPALVDRLRKTEGVHFGHRD